MFLATVMCRKSAYCWKTKPARRSRAGSASHSSPSNCTRPISANSRPPRMRRSVVLPDPEGPRSARNAPLGTDRLTPFKAAKRSKFLATDSTTSDMGYPSMAMRGGDLIRVAPFEKRFQEQSDQCEQRQKRSDRKGADILVIVVKH